MKSYFTRLRTGKRVPFREFIIPGRTPDPLPFPATAGSKKIFLHGFRLYNRKLNYSRLRKEEVYIRPGEAFRHLTYRG